ncbi:MAG: hypothetical protein JST50_20435 [Bacteroidetes bacterium]|jgi:hypothetical protein|nr:hypothetical protein [Bacteroidota bacterium]
MSCCGNKRKAWLNETRISRSRQTINDNSDMVVVDRPDRVFEYTGNSSLAITGAASGKSYSFKFKGDKIKVGYNDSFAMMAERDLRISPKES